MRKATAYVMAAASLALTAVSLAWLFYFIHSGKTGDGGAAEALRNAGLVSAWCMLHSLLARDSVKRLMARITGRDLVRIVYNILSGISLIAVLYFWKDLPGTLWEVRGPAYIVLTAIYLAFLAGMAYSMLALGFIDSAGLTPFLSGNGNDRRPAGPSTAGPYAWCRHPFYVFYILALLTGPVMTWGRIEFAALNILYCFTGVLFEERSLHREFGIAYRIYSEHVPMWIPRFSPWRPEAPGGMAGVRIQKGGAL